MAKRTPVRARKRARPTSPPRQRGVKPGTPSWRKLGYTAELLADCRRRFEDTPESIVSIARDYGVDECTVRRLAERNGWTKYRPLPVDLPPALRLRRQAEELEVQRAAASLPPPAKPSSLPPPARGRSPADAERRRAGGGQSDAATTPSLTLPLAGGGNGEAGAREGNGEAPSTAATVERLHRAVLEELAAVEVMRAQLKRTPQKPADAERTARTLSSLTETVHKLNRMSSGLPQSGQDDDDDFPRDLDEFRNELARRIDAFVASRTEPGDADAGADPAAPMVDVR
jgi:hypothetical protein